MSYEPTTWKSGDVVTSSKLNKMEQGIANAGGGGGVLIVGATISDDTFVCDKTAGEMWAAFISGQGVLLHYGEQFGWAVIMASPLEFTVWNGDSTLTFSADSADDYPSATEG